MSTLILYEDLHDSLSPIWLGKLYPQTLPEMPTYPCGVYSLAGSEVENTLCGPSDLQWVRIRIDCFAKSYAEVIANRDAVAEAMMRFKYQNVPVSEFEAYESSVSVYRRMLDYRIAFNELAAGPSRRR